MTNLIRSPRNAMRATPRLPILIAAVVAVVSGLLLASALTSLTARAQTLTETLWSAEMTVGTITVPGVVGDVRSSGHSPDITSSQLTPSRFGLYNEVHKIRGLYEQEYLSAGTVTGRNLHLAMPQILVNTEGRFTLALYLDGRRFSLHPGAQYEEDFSAYVVVLQRPQFRRQPPE